MTKRRYRHVYGPVSSWRLGRSLGIDPICSVGSKICSFDCVYCQAGKTRVLTGKRRVFVPTSDILEEIKSLPPLKVDYITFSGRGEPCLAKNLGKLIKKVKRIKKAKIAVLTNSSLLMREGVRKDLARADFVAAKLDAHSEGLFRRIDRPAKTIKLKNIMKGIKDFKKTFRGKFALQVMFTRANKKYAEDIAGIAREIGPDIVYINTPLRPSMVKALSKKEIKKISKSFKNVKIRSVYA